MQEQKPEVDWIVDTKAVAHKHATRGGFSRRPAGAPFALRQLKT